MSPITNADLGILFHRDAVQLRQKALAFIILRRIAESNDGLTEWEIRRELRKKYSESVENSDKKSDKCGDPDSVTRALDYLQKTPGEEMKSPFIGTRLRLSDNRHVYRSTGKGNQWIREAEEAYQDIDRAVRNEIEGALDQQFGQNCCFWEEVSGLKKECIQLLFDRLIGTAFNEAEQTLRELRLKKSDIDSFERYHAHKRSQVSKTRLEKKCQELAKRLNETKNQQLFHKYMKNLMRQIRRKGMTVKAWEKFIYAYTYNILLFILLPYIPDIGMNKYLAGRLENTKLCLDTTILLALLLERDRDHTLALEVFKGLEELGARVFWHPLAEKEIRKKFSFGSRAVGAIKTLPPARRELVIRSVWGDGYINTFFNGGYRSTQDLERTAFRKLRKVSEEEGKSFYAIIDGKDFFDLAEIRQSLNSDSEEKERFKETKQQINREIHKKFSKFSKPQKIHPQHDKEILEWVYGLRLLATSPCPTEIEWYLAKYWVVTLDQGLCRASHSLRRPDDCFRDQSLAISLTTLRAILDPADVLQAIEGSSIPLGWTDMALDIVEKHRDIVEKQKKSLLSEKIENIKKGSLPQEDLVAQFIQDLNEQWVQEIGEVTGDIS